MKLSEIVQRINGNIDRFTTELEFYIGGEHMESSELEISNRGLLKENLGKLGFKFHFAFQERDVLFMARNPHLRKAGMVMFSGLCSDATYVLRSKDENIISQEFLAIQLQTDHFWDYCERTKVGSVNFANNWSSIANYDFDLPPINIQKEVASKVWSAYRVKQSYRKLLNAIDDMVKSQFIEMFGGNKVDYVQLSSLCSTFIDGDWIESKDQSESGIRLIQTGNVGCGEYKDKGDKAKYITEDTFNKLHCTEIYPGDILISRLPDPVGRACVLPEGLGKCVTAVDCTIIRFSEKILPNFFVAYTNTPEYLTQIKSTLAGTTRLRVSRGNLGKVKIPVPSIEQQRTFVSIAEQADKSKFMRSKSQFIEMLKGKAINGTISDLVAPKIANVKKTYSHDDTIKYIDISSINAEVHSVSQVTEYSVKNAPSRAQQCVKYGDLLVSTVRPINRNIAIVDKDLDNLVASTGFCVLRPNDGMLNYLLSIVLSDDFTNAMCDKANGGVYPAVNNGDVLNYQIHIPDDDLAKRASLVRQQADKSKLIGLLWKHCHCRDVYTK